MGLVFLELASHWLVPIPAGTQFLGPDGRTIDVLADPLRLAPNIEFRQNSPDFDVLGRTGPLGLRQPEPRGAPEIIFLGDSFTFGQGLGDDETIPALYCAGQTFVCANLGRPGSGQHSQSRILEDRIVHDGWRPKEVKLLIFAMADSIMAGNDFLDTQIEVENERRAVAGEAGVGRNRGEATIEAEGGGMLLGPLLQHRRWVLAHSNLARIAYVQLGPILRSWFAPASRVARLDEGIVAVSNEVERIRSLGDRYGFGLTIYVIHPVQDLMRGTYNNTRLAVVRAAGGVTLVDTAPALLDRPRAYYFPYDGHLNATGAKLVAAFLRQADGR